MQMADRIAEDGYQKAGYEYVCIDVSAKPDSLAKHDLAAYKLCCWTCKTLISIYFVFLC